MVIVVVVCSTHGFGFWIFCCPPGLPNVLIVGHCVSKLSQVQWRNPPPPHTLPLSSSYCDAMRSEARSQGTFCRTSKEEAPSKQAPFLLAASS